MSKFAACFALIVLLASYTAAMPSKKKHKVEPAPVIALGPAMGCNELASVYRNEMTVPYKTFVDQRVRKCVKRQTVTSLNMSLYIATAFYDRNLNERTKAVQKLRSYSCSTENTCKKLFGFIDAHLKATILTKTKESVALFTQLDSFREKLHYDLNAID